MKIAAVFLAALAVAAPMSAGTIAINLNGAVNQSGPLVPGTVQDLLAAWTVTAPNVEDVRITSLRVNLLLTGTASIQNLTLRDGATFLGLTIGNPGSIDTFSLSATVPANATGFLYLYADVLFGGSGTIQASIPIGGLEAVGLASLTSYLAPDAVLSGGIHQDGQAPEPGALFLVGGGIITIWCRRRR